MVRYPKFGSPGRTEGSTGAAPFTHVPGAATDALEKSDQGALARYNIQIEAKDVFGAESRRSLGKRLEPLPEHTRRSVEVELATMDFVESQTEKIEERLGGHHAGDPRG